MKIEDKIRLSDLRVNLVSGVELDLFELREFLRLQGEEYKEKHAQAPETAQATTFSSSLDN